MPRRECHAGAVSVFTSWTSGVWSKSASYAAWPPALFAAVYVTDSFSCFMKLSENSRFTTHLRQPQSETYNLLMEAAAIVQVVTDERNNFQSCVPPDTLHAGSDPEELLQQLPLLPQFAQRVPIHDAFIAMHPRHFLSNMTGQEVRCSQSMPT